MHSCVYQPKSSLIEDIPDLFDSKKPLKFPRNPVGFDYLQFNELKQDTQKIIISQLEELKKMKNLGVFVPDVDEFTNPLVFHIFKYLFCLIIKILKKIVFT